MRKALARCPMCLTWAMLVDGLVHENHTLRCPWDSLGGPFENDRSTDDGYLAWRSRLARVARKVPSDA